MDHLTFSSFEWRNVFFLFKFHVLMDEIEMALAWNQINIVLNIVIFIVSTIFLLIFLFSVSAASRVIHVWLEQINHNYTHIYIVILNLFWSRDWTISIIIIYSVCAILLFICFFTLLSTLCRKHTHIKNNK